MQVSIERESRVVRQIGTSLGELDGCSIEDVTDEEVAAIQAAMPTHGGGVILSADHTSITPTEESEWYTAQQAALAARHAEDAALRAAAQAHPDPVVQALAKRLGLL